MRILAHRGYHRHVPENTLAAFEAARQIGVDGIETDIRLDRDGIPILFHDQSVRGTLVSALSLDDLRTASGMEVPTLEAALTQFPDILWNLEIKDASAVAPAVQVMNRFRDRTRIFVSSFIHSALVECVEQTGLEGGLLVSHRPAHALSLFAGIRPDRRLRTVVWNAATAQADDFRTLAGNGYENMVYGFANSAQHERAPADLVTAIITDFPETSRF